MSKEEVRRLYLEHALELIGYACALLRVRASAEDWARSRPSTQTLLAMPWPDVLAAIQLEQNQVCTCGAEAERRRREGTTS